MDNYFKERAFSRHHRGGAYALVETVKECTRPVQGRARQDPNREEGHEHSIPPVDKRPFTNDSRCSLVE